MLVRLTWVLLLTNAVLNTDHRNCTRQRVAFQIELPQTGKVSVGSWNHARQQLREQAQKLRDKE